MNTALLKYELLAVEVMYVQLVPYPDFHMCHDYKKRVVGMVVLVLLHCPAHHVGNLCKPFLKCEQSQLQLYS